MVMRRVVCAAIRAADGDILVGIRHYSMDMHRQIQARHDGEKFYRPVASVEQGFVDQWGEFMSREQAFVVATEAGQIIRPDACERGRLFSEGLY